MNNFMQKFLSENRFENVKFEKKGSFLIPYVEDLDKEVVIELKKEFFVPFEAVEYDENFHYFMKSFINDDVYNEFLDFTFSDIKRVYELFEEYNKLAENLKNRLKTLGIEMEYKSEFYKKSFIKKRLLEQKSVEYDGKKYIIFFDFFDEDFDVVDGRFLFRKKMNKQFLASYKEFRDGVDLFNSHFKVFNYPNAFSIRGIKIEDKIIGRRKTKKINEIEDNFVKRMLVGSVEDYKVFDSFENKEFVSKVISHNLQFLVKLLKDLENIKDKEVFIYLKEIIYTQLLLIGNNKIRN